MLFVASEVAPLAKTGGLADVAGSLPRALIQRGHDVRVVMPAYDVIDTSLYRTAPADPGLVGFDLGPKRVTADIVEVDLDGLPVTLVDAPGLYRRGSLYTEDPDEAFRFAVLCRASLELCIRWRWAPQVVHCNDWQTGLIPVYLRSLFAEEATFSSTRSVLTIHNLAYQGNFSAEVVPSLGLGAHKAMLDQARLAEGWVSLLRTGVQHADALTTVSPTYAREITTPEFGFGMDDLLRERSGQLIGILNGIDTQVWNPAIDRHLFYPYSAKSLWRKEWNKRRLLETLGLSYREGVTVLGIVSRLVDHKGIGLLPGPVSARLEKDEVRLVALGSGDPALEASLAGLGDRFPDAASFTSGYDEVLAHRIEAGADIFLMPSQFEPSGLNQMYSLAYGTPPVVRNTGGLADTVEHWDPESQTGNGFVFEHYDEPGLDWALSEAVAARGDRKAWKRLQLNGMQMDFSWDRSAAEYERLYQTLSATERESRPANSSM